MRRWPVLSFRQPAGGRPPLPASPEMDSRPPYQPTPPRPVRPAVQPEGGPGARVKVGPWRPPRRLLPLALIPVLVYMVLWLMVGYSLGTEGCRGGRQPVLLLGSHPGVRQGASAAQVPSREQGPSGAPGVAGGKAPLGSRGTLGTEAAVEVLVESERLALPPSATCNRFDAGWETRRTRDREVVAPRSGSGRLQAVNLGEEVPRTLTLDLVRDDLPEGERLSVRSGDRELARATLRSANLPLRVRLPEDLPVGQLALDVVFGAAPASAGGEAARPGVPALYGATLAPALPAGHAQIEGSDLTMDGNCLVYLQCRLAGNEALVGTFVPPAGARPGQRFELTVERQDGSPIRRFRWLPSFWNRWRGARAFELPLRGARGPVRVRLVSRAGETGGPAGRWHALGLVDVTGKILTPGQGQ
jgi:hypothetical protein